DGQSLLYTWLRVIVDRRAYNESELKWNSFEGIDFTTELIDQTSVLRMDAAVRANRYKPMIFEAFRIMSHNLNQRERLILLMRYEQELQENHIAPILGVHPSTVTRQIQKIHAKMYDQM